MSCRLANVLSLALVVSCPVLAAEKPGTAAVDGISKERKAAAAAQKGAIKGEAQSKQKIVGPSDSKARMAGKDQGVVAPIDSRAKTSGKSQGVIAPIDSKAGIAHKDHKVVGPSDSKMKAGALKKDSKIVGPSDSKAATSFK